MVAAGPFFRGSQSRVTDEPPSVADGQPESAFNEAFRSEPRRAHGKELPLAEQPQCESYVSEYAIGHYPVTNAEYAVFIAASNRKPPAHWIGDVPPNGQENHPCDM